MSSNEDKVYVGSLLAFKGHGYRAAPCSLRAFSLDAAVGQGIRLGHERWPDREGYHSHSAVLAELNEKTLLLNV